MGGVEIILASCYRNWDKLWPDKPLGSYIAFTLPYSVRFVVSIVLKIDVTQCTTHSNTNFAGALSASISCNLA